MSTTPRVIRRATLDWVKYDAAIARDGSIDPVDKALYAALASFADSDYRETDPDPDSPDVPTRARLAQCIGRSVDTVDRAIRRLEERGIIRVTRRRDPDNPRRWIPSVYELLDHEWWDERAAERARARAEARAAARGGRMDAARGGRMDAARGGRMDAAINEEKRETGETSSSLLHMTTPSPQAPRQEEEGEATPEKGTAPATGGHGEAAAALVAELPTIAARAGRPLRPLLPGETSRLAQAITAAIARGWTPDQIRDVLTTDLGSARSVVATWLHRLRDLGDPPAPAQDATAAQREAQARARAERAEMEARRARDAAAHAARARAILAAARKSA